jgi:C4-dicarboxylate-specific signal transduction histidine kinase
VSDADAGAGSSAARAEQEETSAARARLLTRERLATLGVLAGGVAHEINNPAAFMLLGVDLLDRLLQSPSVTMDPGATARAAELLREMRASIHRIVDISRDLRLFTHAFAAPRGTRALADVNRTVESALNLTRGRIHEHAQVERSLEDVAPVRIDGGDLGQVIITVLLCAAAACEEAGARSLVVSTRGEGDAVVIEVRHAGERVAQRELTGSPAKARDGDAGGSLGMCREIVARAGGEIRVEGPDGARGTRWVIALPAEGGGDSAQEAR